MKRNQIIVVTACTALLIVIYFFGNYKKPAAATPETPMGGHAQQQAQQPETLDIESYLADVKSKAEPALQKSIDEAEKAGRYDTLVALYKKMDKPLAVAYYSVKLAGKANTAMQFTAAGDYNAALTQTAPDEKAKRFLMENVLLCYKKAADLDTNDINNKLRLAGAYIEDGSQPMQGVMMLLDIVKRDSNNVDAQLMLGRFGLISGQIDKAIARFEKVLYLQPQNSEALFSLAEAYNSKGNKTRAVQLLEKCEKSVKDPATKKDIEKAIESIKKPNS